MAISKQSLRFLLFIPFLFASVNRANAQSIIPAKDGLNTSVRQNGNQYNITGGTQAGANLYQSLQKFGLNANEIANFISNPQIQNIVTRVTGGEASLINGLIKVTGGNSNLYILNPAGIIFGANASLNVPASFSASTASAIQVGNGWFGINSSFSDVLKLTGSITGYAFTPIDSTVLSTGQAGAIANQGNLSVSTGNSVTLVGGIVVNTGTIATPEGNITIAATPDNKFIQITNENNVLSMNLPIADQQAIGRAQVLSGANLPRLLTGKTVVTASVSGNLDVSGDRGGNVQILANNVGLSNANINASGVNKGGTVLIGGDLQGAGTTPTAQSTSVDFNTKISADALTNGNGGKVILWSNGTTAFDGNISAKGGLLSGNGGLVETSGKNNLSVGNTALVNTSALQGNTGTWLLDPTNFTIANTGGDIIPASVIANLDSNNLVLTADSLLTVTDPINASTNTNPTSGNLVLNAPTVNLNAPIILQAGKTLSGTTATSVNVGANGTVQNGIDVAASGANVNLAAATYTLSSTVNINKSLTLNGAGAANTTVSGNNAVRVLNIGNNSTVNINSLTVANGNFIGLGGGAIINSGSTLNVNNSNFSDNLASNSGGAIFNNAFATVTIANSTFSGNKADSGGAIYNFGTATIANSTFSNNSATIDGGAIYTLNGTTTIANSTFSGNTAGGGGAIFNEGTIPAITNSAFSGNTAGVGGAIVNGGTLSEIANSTFSGNTATFGGAIENGGTGTLSAIANSTFSNNTAVRDGGAIRNRGTISAIANSTFSGNSSDLFGGAVDNIGTISAITNSTFSNNTTARGGAIYNNLNANISAIANSTFSNNSATINGGAIYNDGGTVIANSTFSGNSATLAGGAIYNRSIITAIANSILVGNTAPSGTEIYTTSSLNFIGTNIVGTNGVNGIVGISTTATPIIVPTGGANTVINTTLANNGGFTQTFALVAGSIAINASSTAGGATPTTTDQRGALAVGIRDIGAFEFSATPLPIPTPLPPIPTIDPNQTTLQNGAPALPPSTTGYPAYQSPPKIGELIVSSLPSETRYLSFTPSDLIDFRSTPSKLADLLSNLASNPKDRQFNYEMQRVLMKQRILRKGYDSQEIFSVCDL